MDVGARCEAAVAEEEGEAKELSRRSGRGVSGGWSGALVHHQIDGHYMFDVSVGRAIDLLDEMPNNVCALLRVGLTKLTGTIMQAIKKDFRALHVGMQDDICVCVTEPCTLSVLRNFIHFRFLSRLEQLCQ